MRDFYNGLFALGLVAGAGACVLVFILLEWFGFEISASSGFLAALLGAFVGGSFTIAAQMMAADAAAKEARKERDEQSLKIEKAIARSILIKIHDYQNATTPMERHYSIRTKENSLETYGVYTLALNPSYDLRALKFSIEEKSTCLEWENYELINGLNDLEGISTDLEMLHTRYCEKITSYLGAMKPSVHGLGVRAFTEEEPKDDVPFQLLLKTMEQLNTLFNKAGVLLPDVKAMIESELLARFGTTIRYKGTSIFNVLSA